MQYRVKVQQLVDYPLCRVYREHFRGLEKDRSIRVAKTSYLYYYMVLCSYANYRSSYRNIEGTSHLIGPGEWVFRQREIMDSFRARRAGDLFPILDFLQAHHFISYSREKGYLVKITITDWAKFNTALEYNAPCVKAEGFFFLPVALADKLIRLGVCGEMDMLLDLWLHAVYGDDRVTGSAVGAVVYFRDGSGVPFVSCAGMAERWSISKATVFRVLKKLTEKQLLVVLKFPGRAGSAIYLCGYLQTMFEMAETPIDREEVSLAFDMVLDDGGCVSEEAACVSDHDIGGRVMKVEEVLEPLGLLCISCQRCVSKLYPLSGCKGKVEGTPKYILKIGCGEKEPRYRFEFTWLGEILEGGDALE